MPSFSQMLRGILLGSTFVLAVVAFSWKSRKQVRFQKWQREVRVACRLAIACGRAIVSTSAVDVEWKDAGGIDPCTETDRANEALVTEGLSKAFPSHRIVGEEACGGRKELPNFENDDLETWIVDPVDGTQNFVHSFPCSVVSLGLCVRGEAVVGVVYDPHRDELFVAVRGEGAFLNGRRLLVSRRETRIDQALILTDPGYERKETRSLGRFYEGLLEANTRAVRILGSSVLSVCWVAASRASAFVIGFADGDAPKPWDWAAASLIAQEAGCVARPLDERRHATTTPTNTSKSTDNSASFDLYSKSIVCAADPKLAARLEELASSSSSLND